MNAQTEKDSFHGRNFHVCCIFAANCQTIWGPTCWTILLTHTNRRPLRSLRGSLLRIPLFIIKAGFLSLFYLDPKRIVGICEVYNAHPTLNGVIRTVVELPLTTMDNSNIAMQFSKYERHVYESRAKNFHSLICAYFVRSMQQLLTIVDFWLFSIDVWMFLGQ